MSGWAILALWMATTALGALIWCGVPRGRGRPAAPKPGEGGK